MKSSGNRTDFHENSVVLPDTSGKAIKVGTYPSDTGYTWRDITSDVNIRNVAATDPTFTQVGSTAFRFYRFAIGKGVWFNYHVPHDYVPGTDVHFHVHWFVDDSASPASGAVTWKWTFAYAKGFDQEAFDFALANSPLTTANTVTATQDTGVPFQHMVAETAAVTIPGLTEPDGIICTYLERVSNGTSPLNELSSAPFVITSDVHYQSTNIGTLNKAPSFYG